MWWFIFGVVAYRSFAIGSEPKLQLYRLVVYPILLLPRVMNYQNPLVSGINRDRRRVVEISS